MSFSWSLHTQGFFLKNENCLGEEGLNKGLESGIQGAATFLMEAISQQIAPT